MLEGLKTTIVVRPDDIKIAANAADGKPSKLEMKYILLHTLPTEFGSDIEKVSKFFNGNGLGFLEEDVKKTYATINGSLVRVEHNPRENIAANIASEYTEATANEGGYITVTAILDLEAVDDWVLSALVDKKASFSMEVYFKHFKYMWADKDGEIKLTDYYPLGGDDITFIGWVASEIAEFSGSAVTLNPADKGAVLLEITDASDSRSIRESASMKEKNVESEADKENAEPETGETTPEPSEDQHDVADSTDVTEKSQPTPELEKIDAEEEKPEEETVPPEEPEGKAQEETDVVENILVEKARLDELLAKERDLEEAKAALESTKASEKIYKELSESLQNKLTANESELKELASQIRLNEVKNRLITEEISLSEEETKALASKTDEEIEFIISLTKKAGGSKGKPLNTELTIGKSNENPFTRYRESQRG